MGVPFSLSCLRLWSQRNKKLFDFSWLPATILLSQLPTAHPPAYINTKSAGEKVKKKNCNVSASTVFLYPPYDCEKPQIPLWPQPSTARHTHINVWHPGYPDQQNLLFSMPVLDRVVAVGEKGEQERGEEIGHVGGGSGGVTVREGGNEEGAGKKSPEGLGREQEAVGVIGIHYGFLIAACSIFTGNSTDGFLTHDREGKNRLVDCVQDWDHVLVGVTSCYFHLNRPSVISPYPVCSSFAHWNFPHATFPRQWLIVSTLLQALGRPNLILDQLSRIPQRIDPHVPPAPLLPPA